MSFFKDCDVRAKIGSGDDELDPQKAHRLGMAIGSIINKKSYEYSNNIAVGGDIRLSTQELKVGLIEGLTYCGSNVIDLGICSTPYFYYTLEKLKIKNGVMVTASHNPKEYNGFKFVIGPLPLLKEDIIDIEKVYQEKIFNCKTGKLSKADFQTDYINEIITLFNFEYPGKVVIDFSNGCNALYFKRIAEKFIKRIVYINETLDGNFPGHIPNPAVKENLAQLAEKIRITKSDIGIAFDSDGDRVIFLNSKGEMVSNDKMLILLTKYLCLKNKNLINDKVVCETKSSIIVKEELEKYGMAVIFEKTGHTYIKRRVIKENALLGAEITGHYFYRFLNNRDDGIITALMVLNMLVELQKNIELLCKKIPSYFITDDIRIKLVVEERNEFFRKVKEDVSKKNFRLDLNDGIKAYTKDNSWALLRQSITEPLLSLRFEVKEKDNLLQLIENFLESVPELKETVISKI